MYSLQRRNVDARRMFGYGFIRQKFRIMRLRIAYSLQQVLVMRTLASYLRQLVSAENLSPAGDAICAFLGMFDGNKIVWTFAQCEL